MSRALAFAVLLLMAAAAVAPLAFAEEGGEESIPGAKESASAGYSGAKVFEGTAVGADPDPYPFSGLPADPAPDAGP